jgi:Mrp family chromosome partitioning ATPase
MARRNARTLGVCSVNEGEGKSFIALNLAISLALDYNHTALFFEANFRRPHLHRLLDREVTVGLVDVLEGRARFDEALIDIGYPRLRIVPARTKSAMSSELLSSPTMSLIAREALDRSPDGLVIYDLPPVLASDDCLGFLDKLDCCMFVVADDKVAGHDLDQALDLIGRDKLIGTVLNRSSDSAARY